MAKYIDVEPIIEKGIVTTSMCSTSDYARGYNEFYKALCEAPAADVEPVKHGFWTADKLGNFWCSCCKHCGSNDGIDTLYCPNCGAKMDLEANNA